MKTTNRLTYIIGLVVTGLANSVFAIEAPEDDSQPPPPLNQLAKDLPDIPLKTSQQPREKTQSAVAFLGIVSSDIPEILMDHLNLSANEGIIVRSLVPNGPAANAGIKINDVITKVAGQSIHSPLEITHQISLHRPDERITLELIQKGKLVRLDVTLGTRPEETLAFEPQPLNHQDLDGLPKEMADRIRDAISRKVSGMDLQLGGLADQDLSRMQEDAKSLLQQKLKAKIRGSILSDTSDPLQNQPQNTTTIKMKDEEGSVEVKSKDETKEITIRDCQGEITWSGPWNTEGDKSAVSAEIRQRIDGLNLDITFNHRGLKK